MNAERGNPFYQFLMVASCAFVVTVLAYALVPWDNQPAWLQLHGWKLLLVEVAIIIAAGLLSMGLDRIRTLKSAASGDRGRSQEAQEVRQ